MVEPYHGVVRGADPGAAVADGNANRRRLELKAPGDLAVAGVESANAVVEPVRHPDLSGVGGDRFRSRADVDRLNHRIGGLVDPGDSASVLVRDPDGSASARHCADTVTERDRVRRSSY